MQNKKYAIQCMIIDAHALLSSTSSNVYESSEVGHLINIHPIPDSKKYSLLMNP
jgi:hypothetical protein